MLDSLHRCHSVCESERRQAAAPVYCPLECSWWRHSWDSFRSSRSHAILTRRWRSHCSSSPWGNHLGVWMACSMSDNVLLCQDRWRAGSFRVLDRFRTFYFNNKIKYLNLFICYNSLISRYICHIICFDKS